MTTDQTAFTQDELLASHTYAEPLIAGGVRCHGGFDADGNYISPRTKYRWPAIRAWQEQHQAQFGTPLLDVPLDAFPEPYPSVTQAKFILKQGIKLPMSLTLTRIGTVEGFGAGIRRVPLPDLQTCFVEDISGTAMAHLNQGLYEAHTREEAGFEDEGGHKQMWFAARDVALEERPSEEQVHEMMVRRGELGMISGPPTPEQMAKIRAEMMANRMLLDDVDFDLEVAIIRMTRLLLIELVAFRSFAWAEAVLSDTDLVAGEGEAARLVSYVRADEAPHVAYLKCALSEMRDRTFRGASGKTYAGTELVGRIWQRITHQFLVTGRPDRRQAAYETILQGLREHPRRDTVLEEFHALGNVYLTPDGHWSDETPVKATGC